MTDRRTRGIPLEELPPEAQAAARAQLPIELGPNSPLRDVAGAQKAAKRHRVGKSLEDEFARIHELYRLAHRARITKTHPPTAVVGRDQRGPVLRYTGSAAVDYIGTARIGGKTRPIAFDLKSWEMATYAHDPKQAHQLRELLERQRFGELAFLLLIAAPLRVAYLVDAPAALEQLQLGRELLLRRPRFAGVGSGRRVANDPRGFDHLVPHLVASAALLERQDVPRYDYLTLLEELHARPGQ